MRMTPRQSMLAFAAIAFALVGAGSSLAETMTPIGVAGFNVDLIVEASATTKASVNSSIDYSSLSPAESAQFAYYEQGLFSANPTHGVSADTMVSQCDTVTTFKLAPFTSNNAMLIDYDLNDYKTGTLVLSTAAKYSKLAVFGVSGNGGKTLGYTLTYSDNTTSTGNVYFGDWFDDGTNVAIMEHGRARYLNTLGEAWLLDATTSSRNDGANIYQVNITDVDSTKNLVSISFAGTDTDSGEAGGTAVFAISGTAVPEPTAAIMLSTGVGGLLAYAWRKRK